MTDIVRPGPPSIDAGQAPAGVVIHVYAVPSGRLLHTSSSTSAHRVIVAAPMTAAAEWIAAVRSQTCPLCGAGPFKVLALHTWPKHEITARDLHLLAGIPLRGQSVCDPSHSDWCRAATAARLKRQGPSARKLGTERSSAVRRAAAVRRDLADLADAGSYHELARRRGVRLSNLTQVLRNRGIDVPDLRQRASTATCPCGRRFTKRHGVQLYCSKSCATRIGRRSRRPRVTCPVCDTVFQPKPSAGVTYCSKSCAMRARRAAESA